MLDDFTLKLRDMVETYPDTLTDRKLLKSILNDTFPTENREVNLLLNGYDSGIMGLRTLPEDELLMRSGVIQNLLVQDYGITEGNAAWVVDTWMAAFDMGTVDRTKGIVVEQDTSFVERLKDCFDTMVVYKDLNKNNFIASFKLPSFMRDFILKQFQDDEGNVDVDGATDFIREYIPRKDDWKAIQNRIINQGESVKILAKISIDINISNGEITFALPDYGLSYKDTTIPMNVWFSCSDALLKSEENWGVVELGYQYPYDAKSRGKIKLNDYKDFCPYDVDLEEFKDARAQFSLDEWINIVLGAVDYNADGYDGREQKLAVIKRLLPFVEKRINLMEVAPPGTGKSYLFGQVSRYGWLVTAKMTLPKLVYDMGKRRDGIVAMHDFVAMDEIREAEYMKDPQMQSAFQGIMENGKYRAPDNHEVNVDAGIIFLGNVDSKVMDEYTNMMVELPKPFHQVQFLDRIHGFIKGWELPRINDDMKVHGWALNSEYFCSILHELRDDPSYRAIVDARIDMPRKSDTRDTEAVKRIATAFLKLLFPNVRQPDDISARDFNRYCLRPAMDMREIIRIQMGIADEKEAGKSVPDFTVKDV